MITRQDTVSIVITFAVGLFAGAYLYLTGFATTFEPPQAGESNVYTEFVITAEAYGACDDEHACLAFQVLENGAYRAILKADTQTYTKEARIPYAIQRELQSLLTPAALVDLSKPQPAPVCAYTGTNYRFKITRNEVEYVIDTCASAIVYESASWRALAKLWNYMSSVTW